ncbi:DNA adenine methylase [Desulfohalotomaculum tongense]|uniref:DNA adenine methylase n=1 Tax=Desulforadius tongensis TaxID=1216062 RepID=UPI001EE570D7|nr:DNA adenine methylase [Desulforadius tongensis]MBM7854967.1 DNA adenine methylase [Desulforadius tongensis]
MRVLKWPGAKWNIADIIVDLMPKHNIYLEPFFGSGAIFFTKPPCNTEVLNDLDGEVTNLFKVIRDYPEELAKKIYFTPYSRDEYKECHDIPGSGNEIERARRFLVRANMAIAGMQYYSSGWRHAGPVLGSQCKQKVTGDWNKLPEKILQAAERLKDAEIENTDAIGLIEKYNHKDCLIYVDPPYLLSTRKQRYYNVEMIDEDEHAKLIKVLKKHSGLVLLSGYDSELYNDLLTEWSRKEIETSAEQGKKEKKLYGQIMIYPNSFHCLITACELPRALCSR